MYAYDNLGGHVHVSLGPGKGMQETRPWSNAANEAHSPVVFQMVVPPGSYMASSGSLSETCCKFLSWPKWPPCK